MNTKKKPLSIKEMEELRTRYEEVIAEKLENSMKLQRKADKEEFEAMMYRKEITLLNEQIELVLKK